MMKGGGTKYGRSFGAGSVVSVESEKNARGSRGRSGHERNLPFARGVTVATGRNEPPRKRGERGANGSKTLQIFRRGDLEQPMGKESQPGIRRLNLKRMRWRELNGAHASTGSGCLQHTLGMLGEATMFVEGRWCTPYKRSGNSSAPNPTT